MKTYVLCLARELFLTAELLRVAHNSREQRSYQPLVFSGLGAVFVLLPGSHRIRMHAEAAGQLPLAETPHCAAGADLLAERHFGRIERAMAEELDDPWEIAERGICPVRFPFGDVADGGAEPVGKVLLPLP